VLPGCAWCEASSLHFYNDGVTRIRTVATRLSLVSLEVPFIGVRLPRIWSGIKLYLL
jgi:hypothetical protein